MRRIPVAWGAERVRGFLFLTMVAALLAAVGGGCGSGHPRPEPNGAAVGANGGRALPGAYRLQVGDELAIHILDEPDLGGTVKVRPDGKISAKGVGDVVAVGCTVPELTAALTAEYERILRYPDLSVVLSNYAALQVYVFGEVRQGGAIDYMPNMTALHALGAAAGPNTTANLHSALVLRRTGPQEIEVYRVDLDKAIDGEAAAQDIFLQPYDIVYVPRSWIGEVNLFVDKFIRQNIALFTAYIEGWRAFHLDELRTVTVR
jgi:protein involved in polysaccharide export with SLBB domain